MREILASLSHDTLLALKDGIKANKDLLEDSMLMTFGPMMFEQRERF